MKTDYIKFNYFKFIAVFTFRFIFLPKHNLIITNIDAWALNLVIWSIYFLWGKQQAYWHSITLFWHNDLLPPPATWTTHNTVHDKFCINQSTMTQIHGFLTKSHRETLTSNRDDHMHKQSRQWWTSRIALLTPLRYLNSVSPKPPARSCYTTWVQLPIFSCRSVIESQLIAARTGFC